MATTEDDEYVRYENPNELGSDQRRPLRGRPPNTAKLSNSDDPRARAAARAAEIRETRAGMDEGEDDFRAPQAPEGFTYEWKRKSTYGREDVSHQNDLRRKGWEDVPLDRHPDFMPSGSTSSSIEHKGMVLMEIPTEVAEESRKADVRRAKALVQQKAAQLEGGANTLLNEKPTRSLKRSFEAIPVPD